MKERELVGLPLSVQAALRRSEREFLDVLQDMGLDRAALARVAETAQPKTGPAASCAAGAAGRRVRHV